MTTPSVTGQPIASSSTGPTLQGTAPSIAKANEESGERFLKLLMTQIQNQDPLNPMDNAQLTTQMAQINTVAGIDKLNATMTQVANKLSALDNSAGLTRLQESLQTSLQGLTGQLRQSQALQGAGLVGRDVWLGGNALQVRDGAGRGSFDLAGPADAVTVDVLAASGHVIDRIDLGARASGRVEFGWRLPEGQAGEALSYRVRATSAATNVPATLYTTDVVTAVSAGSQGLVLQLARSGATAMDRIVTFN